MILGITGGIGAGKSLVATMCKTMNVPVYDSDARAKWLMNHDQTLKEGIIHLFGAEAYLADHSLNRAYLSGRVFQDKQLLDQLNHLVHPVTGKDFVDWVARNHADNITLMAKEAAILFESGAYLACDEVLTVYAPQNVRLHRVMKRDGADREAILRRMANQWPEWKKIRRSDWLVINDGKHLVIPQVRRIIHRLRDTERQDML